MDVCWRYRRAAEDRLAAARVAPPSNVGEGVLSQQVGSARRNLADGPPPESFSTATCSGTAHSPLPFIRSPGAHGSTPAFAVRGAFLSVIGQTAPLAFLRIRSAADRFPACSHSPAPWWCDRRTQWRPRSCPAAGALTGCHDRPTPGMQPARRLVLPGDESDRLTGRRIFISSPVARVRGPRGPIASGHPASQPALTSRGPTVVARSARALPARLHRHGRSLLERDVDLRRSRAVAADRLAPPVPRRPID